MNETRIRKASKADFNSVASLLKSASLPIDGVSNHIENFLVAETNEGVVGAIGLEVYEEATTLLRSAVVHPQQQGKGIGSQLYDALLEMARAIGVRKLILLTTTAEIYFRNKGFVKIDAKSVRGPITTSVEFTGSCPSTAVCMELKL